MKIKRRKPSKFDRQKAIRNAERALPEAAKKQALCFECGLKSSAMHECLTCEKLGKRFVVFACAAHNEAGLQKVRKHAVVKHPANLFRVIGAGLKGEEI